MWEEKVETWNKKMKQDKKILSKTNKNLNKTNRNLKKKNSLAKALKDEGYPTNKILKITKLSKNIIMML